MLRLNQVWLHALSDGVSSCVNEFKVQLFLQLSGAPNDGLLPNELKKLFRQV